MKAVFGAILLVVVAGEAQPPITYRLEAVKSKVVITHAGQERRARTDEVAEAGDELRTGWLGRATVSVPERASRFEIHASTRVRLAGGEPGVLVVVEGGRLKAIFDALTGNDERLVATPGALLAVRGTRYGIEVDAQGNGTLAVFEGTVEVRPLDAQQPPLVVGVGELCQFGPATPPRRQAMPQGMSENGWDKGGARRDVQGTQGNEGGTPGRQPGPGNPPAQRPAGAGGKH